MGAPKANEAELERRINEVYRLLIDGAKRQDVIQYAAKNDWEIGTRQIDVYIQRANEYIRNESSVDRAIEYGRAEARLNTIYARSMKIRDYKTALAAEKARIELHGLAAPKRQEITGADGGAVKVDVTGMTDDELQRLVEAKSGG